MPDVSIVPSETHGSASCKTQSEELKQRHQHSRGHADHPEYYPGRVVAKDICWSHVRMVAFDLAKAKVNKIDGKEECQPTDHDACQSPADLCSSLQAQDMELEIGHVHVHTIAQSFPGNHCERQHVAYHASETLVTEIIRRRQCANSDVKGVSSQETQELKLCYLNPLVRS